MKNSGRKSSRSVEIRRAVFIATGRGKLSMTCSGALDLKGTYDEHFRGGIG